MHSSTAALHQAHSTDLSSFPKTSKNGTGTTEVKHTRYTRPSGHYDVYFEATQTQHPFQFIIQIVALSAPANETQRKYGSNNHAAKRLR